MRVVRENFNPWHLETNLNGGDLFDKALKNAKWDDEDGTVTITGTDNKTGDSIEVIFEVADDRAKFISMEQEGEEKSYALRHPAQRGPDPGLLSGGHQELGGAHG